MILPEILMVMEDLQSAAISADGACSQCKHPSCARRRLELSEAREEVVKYWERSTLTPREAAMALSCISGINFTFSAPNLRRKLESIASAEPSTRPRSGGQPKGVTKK